MKGEGKNREGKGKGEVTGEKGREREGPPHKCWNLGAGPQLPCYATDPRQNDMKRSTLWSGGQKSRPHDDGQIWRPVGVIIRDLLGRVDFQIWLDINTINQTDKSLRLGYVACYPQRNWKQLVTYPEFSKCEVSRG